MVAGLTLIHIVAGGVALASGLGAFLAPKGERVHRVAGVTFVVSMLIMAGLGAAMAALKPDRGSVEAGLLTLYLVATGWMTVNRPAGRFGFPEWIAVALGAVTAAVGLAFGLEGLNSPTGLIDGLPPQPVFVFAGLAALGTVLDLSLLIRRGVRGRRRLARHLWRMGVALVIAAASFFLGQQQVFPEAWRGLWLGLPVLAVLVSTLAWLGLTLSGILPRRRAALA